MVTASSASRLDNPENAAGSEYRRPGARPCNGGGAGVIDGFAGVCLKAGQQTAQSRGRGLHAHGVVMKLSYPVGIGLVLGTFMLPARAGGAASGQAAGPEQPGTAWKLVRPGQKVTAKGTVRRGFFGYSVAASGHTLVISEPGATVQGHRRGAVYVFEKSNGAWTGTQRLTADDGAAGDGFGISVSLAGAVLLVGASHRKDGRGAVYVFGDSNGTWYETQELTATDGVPGQGFGHSVAVSGTQAIVGAPGDDSFRGAAYVFAESNGTWSQVKKLTPGKGATRNHFGAGVAISGATVLVGASICRSFKSPQGAAYVFTGSGGTWSRRQKLTAGDGGPGDCFGHAVALSGPIALIGAQGAGGASGDGAAYVFTGSGGTWSQAQKLTGNSTLGPESFGQAVGLSGSGKIAIVGAPTAAAGGTPATGAAYLFMRSGGRWHRRSMLAVGDPAPGEVLGFAVGLAGRDAVATAVPDFGGGPGPGAGYVFRVVAAPRGR